MHGKHKSLDKHLKQSVNWLLKRPEVHKVILGISEACRHRYAPGTLRVKAIIPAGLRVNGYSGNGVMDIFVRTHYANTEHLASVIKNKFSKSQL